MTAALHDTLAALVRIHGAILINKTLQFFHVNGLNLVRLRVKFALPFERTPSGSRAYNICVSHAGKKLSGLLLSVKSFRVDGVRRSFV